jgi:tetratricopeptide (TPR) repeat protein
MNGRRFQYLQNICAILITPPALGLFLTVQIGIDAFAENPAQNNLEFHRNQGAAHYENQDYKHALTEFEKCIEISVDDVVDWVNLGLACYRTRDYDRAVQTLEKARRFDPKYLHFSYTLGLIYKRLDMLEQSAKEFELVIKSDPADASTYYSLGVVYDKLELEDKALSAFRATVRHNPEHPSAHYYLFKYAKQQGRKDESKREMKIFSRLQRSTSDRQRTEAFYEEGPYLKAVTIPVRSFAPSSETQRNSISFRDITKASNLTHIDEVPDQQFDNLITASDLNATYISKNILPGVGGAVGFVDVDNDGDRDIYLVRCAETPDKSGNKLYINDGTGRFANKTTNSASGNNGMGMSIAVGDYDNDGTPDLYVLNYGANVLLQNRGDGTFKDVTESTGAGHLGFGKAAAFFDYDHDGDLDLLVANYCDVSVSTDQDTLTFPEDFPGEQNRLYRNNGDSTFTAVPDSLRAAGEPARTVAISFGDCDDDDDTDLLIMNEDIPLKVRHNMRAAGFELGNSINTSAVQQGDWHDFDNDGDLDIILICSDASFIYDNDGKGEFTKRKLPSLSDYTENSRTTALELIDFDNDGLTDILAAREDGRLGLFANNGSFDFVPFSEDLPAPGNIKSIIVSLDAGDIDNDGDQDIVGAWSGGIPFLLENRGGESANWLEVEPIGERFSLQAIGAKLEIRSGHYYQRKDVTEWPVHIGLGEVDRIDVLRASWTNGIIQNMTSVPIRQHYQVKEIVRTDASCPFLFAFDGEKYNYINDILGVSALGVPFDVGVYHIPDPDEYVKIEGNLLTDIDGLYQLRLAAELKEIAYVDQLMLIVVDHPANIDVYPNERFSEPPFIEPGIHIVANKFHPETAIDHNGMDILYLIEQQDMRYPSSIAMTSYDGLAERHWIEFDLGELTSSDSIMLYLTGWIYWSSSSANVVISQNDQFNFEAVSLSVPDENGNWVVIISRR